MKIADNMNNIKRTKLQEITVLQYSLHYTINTVKVSYDSSLEFQK